MTGLSASGTVACATPSGSGTINAGSSTQVGIYCAATTICGYATVTYVSSTNTFAVNNITIATGTITGSGSGDTLTMNGASGYTLLNGNSGWGINAQADYLRLVAGGEGNVELELSTDNGISRDAAGVLDFGNGTYQDKSGTINAATGTFSGTVSSTQICLGGTCKSVWPSGTGGGVASSGTPMAGQVSFFNPDANSITGITTTKVNTSTYQITITCNTTSGSQSVGGCININGTNATTSAFVLYDNQANEASGQAAQITCDTAFNTFDCFVDRDLATGTTAFDVQGYATGKGVIKCEHFQDGTGVTDNSNASCVSIALNGTSTAASGVFLDSASGTTGYDFQFRDKGVTLFSLQPENGGFKVITTSTFSGQTNLAGVVSTTITSALISTNASGTITAYGGTSCSGANAITALSGNASATCTAFLQTAITTVNGVSGATSLNITCASGCSVATSSNAGTVGVALTVTAAGGSGTVSTSSVLTSGSITLNTGTSTIGNSSLSQSGGTTYINGTTPVLDGGGDVLSNVIQPSGANVIAQQPTSTAFLGNLVQSGGVELFTASATVTAAQFCGGGLIMIASTTATTTITLPTLANIASSTISPCATSIVASAFAQQFIVNSSTKNVNAATNGSGEVQLYAPGTPTVLAPGQVWFVQGQFVNTSTIAGATTAGTVLEVSYSLYQTSTPLTINGNTITLPNIASNSFLATDANHNLISTTTPAGGSSVQIPTVTVSTQAGANFSSSSLVTAVQSTCNTTNYPNGALIWLPDANYTVTSTGSGKANAPIKLCSGVTLQGNGRSTKISWAAPATSSVLIAASGTAPVNIGLYNLYLNQTSGTDAGVALDWSNWGQSTVSQIESTAFTWSTQSNDTSNNTFYDHFSDWQGYDDNGWNLSSTNAINDNYYTGIYMALNQIAGAGPYKGLYLNNGQTNTFINLNCEPSTLAHTTCIDLETVNAEDTQLIDSYIENAATGTVINSAERTFIDNANWNNNTTNLKRTSDTNTTIIGLDNNFGVPTNFISSPFGYQSGSAPTVSACGGSPSITGTDNGGIVTTGNTGVSACTVTFTDNFTTTPFCVGTLATTSVSLSVSSTAVGSVIFKMSGNVTSTKLYYSCGGINGN